MRRQSRCWAALPSSTASVTVPMMAMLVHPRDSLFHSSPGQQAAPHAPSSSSTSPLPDVKGAFAASVSSPAQHLVPVSHHSSGSGCFSCELESPTQPARTTVTVCTEVMSPAPGGAWSPRLPQEWLCSCLLGRLHTPRLCYLPHPSCPDHRTLHFCCLLGATPCRRQAVWSHGHPSTSDDS